VRFAGEVGEQWITFFRDPAGNAVEFKAFADETQIFGRYGALFVSALPVISD
jgi:uncharacterized protein